MITRLFVDVACDLPERRAGALFLEFANAAVSWVGQIIPGAAIMDGSRSPQRPTVRTDIDVARSVVSEVEAREHAVSSPYPSFTGICGVMSLSRSQASSL